jgi:hypothetical protein
VLSTITAKADRAATLSSTIDAAIERLAHQLAEGHTQEFLEMLAFYGRFWKYSIGNMLLIRAQCPMASRVAGMRSWNELGYTVKKGEKANWIWCPMLRKEVDPQTGDTVEVVTGFRPGPVFDVSQLKEVQEKPLPDLFTPLPDDVQELYRGVRARIEAEGIAIEERLLPPGVQGASQGGRILVRPDIDSRNKLFVLLHELAHELAHHQQQRDQKMTGQRELEAESTAFVVAAVLGLEIPSSRDYLLSWQGTADELRASLSAIQQLVRRMLAIVGPYKATTPLAA